MPFLGLLVFVLSWLWWWGRFTRHQIHLQLLFRFTFALREMEKTGFTSGVTSS